MNRSLLSVRWGKEKDKALRWEMNAREGLSMVHYGLGKDSKSEALEPERPRLNSAYTIHCITLGKLLRLSEFVSVSIK